ncbi:gliding motility-associated-like protein [Roseivirga ehrenbergii]|uniref:PKD domain-containing protein n=1 Tax=Roseivirga ehrenbergii (strain DSM 102268 / JCM 13514 / KCTC 12282 / NCIMB 14502 / KMM 6017) TaxID=279360 RepID=A0A150X8D5_ROSEK|nr:Ig-like domain-containing protein [Roseivirga ehrenbergii]KYG74989.1 hypothetical protein MB14_07255 [Roseivirga ehrenbergii]TCL13661.1 gliding motility-associated-like protein [Roseivirga ehrenbergii]
MEAQPHQLTSQSLPIAKTSNSFQLYKSDLVSKLSCWTGVSRIAMLTLLLISFVTVVKAQTFDAKFSATPTQSCSNPQIVSFTDQSVNPDTWSWNFGDGGTSRVKNPSHTYTTTGNFTVRLTVQDTIFGYTDTYTETVSISVATADFTGTSLFGCGPLTVNFTDASSISGANTIVGWAWDFGDGSTSTSQNPSHVYDKSGAYTVKLKITDSGGCTHEKTRTNYVQVIGPMVKFSTTGTTILGGTGAITFQNQSTSTSPIVNWSWNFGDGSTSNLQNPTHTYTTSGTFDVSLTVSDLDGCSRTLTKTNYVNTISGAFDISKAIFEGNEDRFSVAAQESEPRAIAFNLDGTKLYVMGSSGDDINEYNLSVAYDVTSSVYAGDAERFSVALEETNPRSFAFNNDGSKMFVIGTIGDDVNEYNLSTAFDISTAVFAGNAQRFSVAAQETYPTSLTFNHDGTKMYVAGSDNDAVNEYILSEAFDVSSATYSKRLLVGTQELFPQSIVFVNNGFNLLLMGSSGDDINQYTLTTAFDLSTAAFAGNAARFSVASQDGQPNSVTFNSDGTKMFVLGFEGKDINEYSLAVPVITGAVANQAVNDNATISPFSAITIADPNGDNVSATIALDDNAKGVLSGTGLTGSGPYTLASTDAASLQASLRALVFNPTDNRVASGSTEKTTFTIQLSDGERNDTDANTTVISSPVAPTVSLSSLATSPTNGFDITITFSENVTGFTVGDINVGNGTASAFNATSPSVYTALITPTTDGAVTVDVATNVAQDASTNGNTAATQFSLTADLTSPTVAITSTAADPIDGAFTTTFTFSEAVTGFAIGDITVANGTASNFVSTSATVYTALITPTTDGAVTVDVAANVAQDAATNGNTAAAQFGITADLTSPTVAITSTAANQINGAFTTTFTFSEAVTGFAIGDITVANGTASNFASTSATVYTALITPTTDGAVTVDVSANVAQDAATNENTAATQFSITADLTSPTVAITSTAANPINSAFIATFTFSEDVTGFVLGDITVANGTASNFASTSATVYTVLITPTTDGAVTIDVAANVAQDAATNGNAAATQFSIIADLTSPTVAITSTAANPINGAFTTTFTFSEAVTGFVVGDITVANGTASNFASTSATVYTALITPTTDGAVTVDVSANVAQDAATNGNIAVAQFSLTADLTSPTVAITSTAANPINGAFTTTFTFSEAVTGFVVGDVTLNNASASNFTAISATVYTVLITPTTDGAVTVDVAANIAQDAATNGNTAAAQFSLTADLTSPTVVITSTAADPIDGAFTTTFTFSEAVTGFAIGDITVANGTASNFASTSATIYTALITPTTDGAVTADVAANVAQDAATNGNTAAAQFSITADLTSPAVAITSTVANPINGAFTTTFTFSEAITGFVLGDINVGNGTASAFNATSPSVYTALITPTTDGAVTVDVAANVAQDAATNGNTAAAQFSIDADLTNPNVVITSPAANPINGAFTTTFTFREAVTGFTIGDITLNNASASNFTAISATVYIALITPTTDGAVTVDVAANVAQDAATNGNTAAAQFSLTADLTSPTVAITNTAANPINGAFTATFTFSEAVTSFAVGDINVGNGTASAFNATSASVYTTLITPTTDGAVTVDVAANVAQDAATNGNTAATQFSITADLTSPTVAITSTAADPIDGVFTTTFTFSEAVTGFDVSDIVLGNAVASNFLAISNNAYSAILTPITDGAVTIDVAANVAQDVATNGNTAAAQFSTTADLTSPTVAITSTAADPIDGAFTTTFTFSEAVTGFTIGDISVVNGTTSNFTSINPSVYTTSISPTADGVVTVDVPENIAQDVARNGNVAATQFSIIADLTDPEVSMSGIPIELNNFEPFTIIYSFSEKVTGFAGTDFQLVNAQLVDFSTTDNINYNVSFKAQSNQEVRLTLPANTVYDLATNANTTETVVDISFNSLPMDISLSSLSIDENNSLAAEIGQFTTADADVGDVQTYSLVAGVGSEDNDKFSITFNMLRAASIFDFEIKSIYNIRIKTDDGRGGVFEKTFVISINDLNEQPTNISLSNTLIDETDETDILVGLFAAEDQDDGESFTYELVSGNGDDNNGFFKIINNELHTSQAINFETHELLSIRVRVIDAGGLTFEKPFEIAVNNVVNEEIRDFTKDKPSARIKNFFTPNGDGVNDVWIIEDIIDNPENEVKVFAQNGKVVFSAKSYQNDWGGKFEGQLLPTGTYYYDINISNGRAIIRGILLILTK